ncbi:MAG TPA: phosphatase PAP2 family protein [Acidimicrobiales bacterium]|nr:phosphatase PAP2 family protein [Acidimicrobiales bacterium]
MRASDVPAPPPRSPPVAAFDRRVDDFFEAHLRGRPVLDHVFYGASALGDHGLLWHMLAVARGLRTDEDWRAVARTSAAVGIESALVNGPVKWVFRRTRPVLDLPHALPLRRPRTSSFPSGHATSAFCAAALLSDGDPAWQPVYYALALIVATSRVYVRIHHPSDVVGGIGIGVVLGAVGRRLLPLPARAARARGGRHGIPQPLGRLHPV